MAFAILPHRCRLPRLAMLQIRAHSNVMDPHRHNVPHRPLNNLPFDNIIQ